MNRLGVCQVENAMVINPAKSKAVCFGDKSLETNDQHFLFNRLLAFIVLI
jgi:hypothetical protein